MRGHSLRLPPPRPRNEQIYFIGATNVPIEQLDPALTRPGGWAGTSGSARRRSRTARTSSTSTSAASRTIPDLDRPERRDELARMTMGYSPAMIEQVCSMALTVAHHTGREAFGWEDIVDAMTTVESGTAVEHRVRARRDARRRGARGRATRSPRTRI